MSFESGTSFRTLRRDSFDLPDFANWEVPFETLPTRYAPLEKQARVFVNDTEYTYDDGTDPSLTTAKWTWAEGSPVTGVRCSGVRFQFTPFTGSTCRTEEFALFDTNGWVIPSLAGASGNTYDGDGTTGSEFSSPGTVTYNFPSDLLLQRVGWTRSATSTRDIRNMTVSVNRGTADSPDWVTMSSGVYSSYPSISTPYNPETDTVQVSFMGSGLVETRERQTLTITPALTLPSDRLTILRETRQDRPWVTPPPGSRAYGQSLHWFWEQYRFIYQELCEIESVAAYIGLPVAERVLNDYSYGSQIALGTNDGTSRSTLDYSGIELLTGFPGAPADPQHQLIMEEGNTTAGNSTSWSAVNATYDASTGVATRASGATTNDLRVRRVTRKDKLWLDIETVGPIGWNTSVVQMLQKQIRFLQEESCFLPRFYAGHPLNFPIFPRAWNWLNFVGGGGSFTFGGPYWGGDGEVVVYRNDVLLTPGDDYTVNWPEIVLTTPAGPNDVITVGGGGGGGGGPVGIPGGDDPPSTLTPPPPIPGDPVEWPGLDLSLGFSIEISTGTEEALEDGTWEGGTTLDPAPPTGVPAPFYLKILVRGTDPDAASFNRSGVLYMRGPCSTEESSLHGIAQADDSTGDGTFNQTDFVSAALGCLGGDAVTSQNLVRVALAGITRGPATNPLVALAVAAVSGMQDADIAGNAENIPFMAAWTQLASDSQAAADAGVVSSAGFTAEQFQNYIDPDVEFNDFDIPAP